LSIKSIRGRIRATYKIWSYFLGTHSGHQMRFLGKLLTWQTQVRETTIIYGGAPFSKLETWKPRDPNVFIDYNIILIPTCYNRLYTSVALPMAPRASCIIPTPERWHRRYYLYYYYYYYCNIVIALFRTHPHRRREITTSRIVVV